jgi:hypothetical protein
MYNKGRGKMWQQSGREDALRRSAAGRNTVSRVCVGVLRAGVPLGDMTFRAAL